LDPSREVRLKEISLQAVPPNPSHCLDVGCLIKIGFWNGNQTGNKARRRPFLRVGTKLFTRKPRAIEDSLLSIEDEDFVIDCKVNVRNPMG
jgi:hypothetical protein